ncbi:MAG: hypothetical protein KGH53_02860 [Candidatus Micrarchaeota archaeon]|nr:hypothetical protein [Candidatus Micrarchaeota archaeon]
MIRTVSANKEEEAQKLPDSAWHVGREWGMATADMVYSTPPPADKLKIEEMKGKMRKEFFDLHVFFHPTIPDPALTQLHRGFEYGFDYETKSKKQDDISDLCP